MIFYFTSRSLYTNKMAATHEFVNNVFKFKRGEIYVKEEKNTHQIKQLLKFKFVHNNFFYIKFNVCMNVAFHRSV